jgi:hypothetical protein
MTDKVLGLAMELSSDVTAVRLAALEGPDVKEEERKLREQWAKDVEEPARAAHYPHPPKLAFLSPPYRRIHAPFLKLIKEIEDKNPDRTIAVLIPELVKQHWWDYLLTSQHARRLRSLVLAYGGPRVVVIAVPWYLTPPKIEEAMSEEEAGRSTLQGAKCARLQPAALKSQASVGSSLMEFRNEKRVHCAPRVIEDYELGADQGGSIEVDERLQLVELEFEVSRRNPVKHALAFKTGQRAGHRFRRCAEIVRDIVPAHRKGQNLFALIEVMRMGRTIEQEDRKASLNVKPPHHNELALRVAQVVYRLDEECILNVWILQKEALKLYSREPVDPGRGDSLR